MKSIFYFALLGCCLALAFAEEESDKYIPAREVYGIDGENRLVIFNSRDVDDIQRYYIKDCYADEKIRGIDFKGYELYGVSENRVFEIDYHNYKIKNAKELIGCRLEGTGFGVDFVPDSCSLRVISNTGQNLLIDVYTGYCQVQKPIEAYDEECKEPKISGAAYYNTHELYVIDYENDVLGEIKYPVSYGKFKEVGPLCYDTSVVVGFEIFQEYGKYYAWATLAKSSQSGFFWIDLNTGKAHLIDWIQGSRISSLTVKCDYSTSVH